jgi:hypothetical protein
VPTAFEIQSLVYNTHKILISISENIIQSPEIILFSCDSLTCSLKDDLFYTNICSKKQHTCGVYELLYLNSE